MKILATMSGSSLDGLDIGIIEINFKDNFWQYEIINPETISYSDNWRNKLSTAHNLLGEELIKLDFDYARLCSQIINNYRNKNAEEFSCISYHGHTIFHNPHENYTFQLGKPATIAALCSTKVIGDFRSTDISLHGQGAPLMAIVDEQLFGEYGACVNLGGICNMASFDIAPCNQILNALANELDKEYDHNGEIASRGRIIEELADFLASDPFYKLLHPKSLDNNYIREKIIKPLLEKKYTVENKMTTTVHFIANEISKCIVNLDKDNYYNSRRILFTGGGALNSMLKQAITHALADHSFEAVFPTETLIEYKELLLMGLLAYLRINIKQNIKAKFTGSAKDSISGAIYEG